MEVLSMFIRPGILAKKKQACPPLIVLAVLATQAAVSLSKAV